MDLIKQYITQCIVAAANNLRLNSEKIEIVALIREYFCNTEDIEKSLKEMKKVTELSTFAIRISDIYNYLSKSKIDFLKISDRFKEHCHSLVRDMNILLDKTTPQNFNTIIHRIEEETRKVNSEITIPVPVVKDEPVLPAEEPEQQVPAGNPTENGTSFELLEEASVPGLVNETIQEDFFFEDFEEKIITPIKELDSILKNLMNGIIEEDKLNQYYETMLDHSRIAEKAGFEIIANMHRIFAAGLKLILDGELEPQKEIIESLRACLIVIVAVVRGKEVDITAYLNMAEDFGRYLIYK